MAAILPSINTQVESTLIDLSRRKPNLAAYEHLLIGIRHLRGYEPDDNAKATACFDRALAADPGFALTTANRRERVEIGPRTLVPYWCGERMDDAMAVEGLLRRE